MISTTNARSILDRLRLSGPAYRLRLAESAEDLRAAQVLRFLVFNVEMQEGLAQSFATCLDADAFDPMCDHLLVENTRTDEIVGTYRLQTGVRAQQNLGYYSAREFDFAPFESQRPVMLELGRACIHSEHRSFAVLSLLWRGIAGYAQLHQQRYLIGCSSLTTQDGFACPLDVVAANAPKTPKLLAAYLSLGAMMCSAPAIDRDFGTIDFLTLVDLQSPAQNRRLARFGVHI
jgi:putative hemolysin